jgi:hypothetical protein
VSTAAYSRPIGTTLRDAANLMSISDIAEDRDVELPVGPNTSNSSKRPYRSSSIPVDTSTSSIGSSSPLLNSKNKDISYPNKRAKQYTKADKLADAIDRYIIVRDRLSSDDSMITKACKRFDELLLSHGDVTLTIRQRLSVKQEFAKNTNQADLFLVLSDEECIALIQDMSTGEHFE